MLPESNFATICRKGTVPSFVAIDLARKYLKIGFPIIIRPRKRDFLYSEPEFEILARKIEIVRDIEANGVVFGVLDENGEVDIE